ncbi:MAG: hypothetical protein R2755_26715 [Acidimicrobiales bacterium]
MGLRGHAQRDGWPRPVGPHVGAGGALDYVAAIEANAGSLDGVRIGLLVNESIRRHSAEWTWQALLEALEVLRGAGAEVVEVEAPLYDELHAATFLGLQCEAYSYHRNDLVERWGLRPAHPVDAGAGGLDLRWRSGPVRARPPRRGGNGSPR